MTSCLFDPDTVSVMSTPALVGVFGAKLSEILCQALFEQDKRKLEGWRPPPGSEQIGGVLCWMAITGLLGLAPFLDVSGLLGGFVAGFFMGMIIFSCNIRSPCQAIGWFCVGFIITLLLFIVATGWVLFEVEPNGDLLDACEYYRAVYLEDYDCDCAWMFEGF